MFGHFWVLVVFYSSGSMRPSLPPTQVAQVVQLIHQSLLYLSALRPTGQSIRRCGGGRRRATSRTESSWAHLGQHVWLHPLMPRCTTDSPQTVQELADALVQVWEEIPQEGGHTHTHSTEAHFDLFKGRYIKVGSACSIFPLFHLNSKSRPPEVHKLDFHW